jgi:hypothetical protein
LFGNLIILTPAGTLGKALAKAGFAGLGICAVLDFVILKL